MLVWKEFVKRRKRTMRYYNILYLFGIIPLFIMVAIE